jgi:hypothetical protein
MLPWGDAAPGLGCGAKGFAMVLRYYRLLPAVAASVSLLVAGCGGRSDKELADPVTGAMPNPVLAQKAAQQGPTDDTDQTIWTVLGLAKRETERNIGPQTGNQVSPVLWEATHDALNFTRFSAEDPFSGLVVTEWYSPARNPAQRLRVSVYILSRALRSDSLAVTVERQERGPNGEWRDAPVDRDVGAGIENAILQRARQIHAERYRNTM